MAILTQEKIDQIAGSAVPKRLSPETGPAIPDDHVAHIVQLTQWGHTALAADHLLFPEINGALCQTIGGVIRRLNIQFTLSNPAREDDEESLRKKVLVRQYAYEVLMAMALNFYGLESRWLDEREKEESLQSILSAADEWEDLERKEGGPSIASSLVKRWLSGMKRVQKGNSMVAKTADRLEKGLDFSKNLLVPLLQKAEKEIQGNIYYRMVNEGTCKFGNDYALGLRWLRHLGYEQVSTNPYLAARAYEDEPSLFDCFRGEVKHHPSYPAWAREPEKQAEVITLYATLLALWDNLYVFRPIFYNLQETSGGGVVSFQLNPNIAHLVEESIRDVFQAFALASGNLSVYDQYLLAGYNIREEKGRPNMVIKVAATTPAAKTITRMINSFGFGSNITVDYSVSQEATLVLEEMEGMAGAVRKGIRPTQLYMTNMGGRLESHLREVKFEEWFEDLRKKLGEAKASERVMQLSERNGTREKVSKATSFQEKVLAATRYANQKKIDEPVYEALNDIASKEALQNWEQAIGAAGTLVARRVWWMFFSDANRERWLAYLVEKKGLNLDQARLVMDRICYLPASKRKPFDTYWTLSSRNMVHTEFPDHQENVRKMAEARGFDLKEYEESISHPIPQEALRLLEKMEDFRKAYEVNSELAQIFREVGIVEDLGTGGLLPSDWPEFGPVRKTLAEFKGAYEAFQKKMVSIVRELSRGIDGI